MSTLPIYLTHHVSCSNMSDRHDEQNIRVSFRRTFLFGCSYSVLVGAVMVDDVNANRPIIVERVVVV